MKRSKFVAGLLALSMVLMGTGYAYWTDSLKIETTATTGELEVKFVDIAPYGVYDDEKGWSIYDGTGMHEKEKNPNDYTFNRGEDRNSAGTVSATTGYNDIGNDALNTYEGVVQQYNNITTELGRGEATSTLGDDKAKEGAYSSAEIITSDAMTMHIDNMYPGYAQFFQSDILNTGTVAAKLSDVKYDIAVGTQTSPADIATLKNMIGVNLDIKICNPEAKDPVDKGVLSTLTVFNPEDKFEVGGRTFVRLSAIEREKNNKLFKLPLNNFIIKAKDEHASRLDVYTGIAMDPDREGVYTTGHTGDLKENNDALSQLGTDIKVTATLQWDQFNAPNNTHNPDSENKPAPQPRTEE